MPWFRPRPEQLVWSTIAHFERRIVRHFGAGRVWLAGDSAHVTSPIGFQNMNRGFVEASELADLISGKLQGAPGAAGGFERFERGQQTEWRRLFGLGVRVASQGRFARRFATYKRPNLLLHDPARLLRLLSNPQRPVQLVIAGKAHPADAAGRALIQEWMRFIRQPSARARAVLLSDYDMLLGEHLVQGTDLWLNTPRRPFYARDGSGIPTAWVKRTRESMAQLTPRFSTTRSVRQYTEQLYLPAAAYRKRAASDGVRGLEIVRWRQQLEQSGFGLRFGALRVKPRKTYTLSRCKCILALSIPAQCKSSCMPTAWEVLLRSASR